ncbi:cell adhesion molecule 1-like isoform X3 [Tachysurus vachellii]|uniref:cell adhesion molecule 1-like isoform X3 n=1 Tax=Tachysurus vachellii TaxID=175792 RepID=UPI00296AC589|nr:cell adhesion molecule 1-like isoform X3 [Tachysurus vachellii]
MVCFRTGLTCFCLLFLFFTSIKAIKVIGRDVTVTAGDDAQLFCEAFKTTEPLTTIRWQRRTKKNPTNADFLLVTSSGKEEYINTLRERVKFAGNLAVLDGSIRLVPPVVTVGTDVPAVAGDTEGILATCTAANAKPEAEVLWSLGALNNTVKVQNTVTVDSEDRYTVKSNLIGTASKDLNQKKVQCVVTHPGLKQELELNYTLDIHYPPQVVYISSAGDQGALQCEADANPKPTNFTWSRYFPVKETLSSGVNSSLIVQLTPGSNRPYYCVASNQYGEAVGSFYMYDKTSTESKILWTLFILTLVAVCCFLIWNFELFQRVNKILRSDISQPVPTVSSDHKEVCVKSSHSFIYLNFYGLVLLTYVCNYMQDVCFV